MFAIESGENRALRLAVLTALLIGVSSLAVSKMLPGWRIGGQGRPAQGPAVITIDRTNDYEGGLPGGVFDSGRTNHMIRNSMRGGMWSPASNAPFNVGWSVNAPQSGRYAIRVRYAAVTSRPMEVFLNDQKVMTALARTTPSRLQPEWFREGTVELRAGHNSLCFHSDQPPPNIDAVKLIKLDER
jgi:hypothetical protein